MKDYKYSEEKQSRSLAKINQVIRTGQEHPEVIAEYETTLAQALRLAIIKNDPLFVLLIGKAYELYNKTKLDGE